MKKILITLCLICACTVHSMKRVGKPDQKIYELMNYVAWYNQKPKYQNFDDVKNGLQNFGELRQEEMAETLGFALRIESVHTFNLIRLWHNKVNLKNISEFSWSKDTLAKQILSTCCIKSDDTDAVIAEKLEILALVRPCFTKPCEEPIISSKL